MLDFKLAAHCSKKLAYKTCGIFFKEVHRYAVWNEAMIHEEVFTVRGCVFRYQDCPRCFKYRLVKKIDDHIKPISRKRQKCLFR